MSEYIKFNNMLAKKSEIVSVYKKKINNDSEVTLIITYKNGSFTEVGRSNNLSEKDIDSYLKYFYRELNSTLIKDILIYSAVSFSTLIIINFIKDFW